MTISSKLLSSYGYKLGLTLLGITKGVLLARLLGPTGRGVFALAAVVQSTALRVASLGQNTAVIHFSSRSPNSIEQIFFNCIWQGIVVGGLVATITGLVGLLLPSIPLPWIVMSAVVFSIPVILTYDLTRGLLLGKQNVDAFNHFELVAQLTSVLTLAVCGFSIVLQPAAAIVLAQIFPACVALLLVCRSLGFGARKLQSFNWHLATTMCRFGARAGIVSILVFAISEVNILLISHQLGMAEAGYYALAQKATVAFSALTLPLTQILLPHLSSADLGNDSEGNWRLVQRSAAAVATMSAGVCLVLVGAIRPIITLLYGEDFLPAAVPCLIMSASQIFETATSIILAYLASAGFPTTVVKILTVTFCMELGLSYELIAFNQVNGAATSYLVSQIVTLVLLYRHSSDLHLSRNARSSSTVS
ncbi:MAG: oligosaccharide flippase family protein [Bdellovibrionota bacterium]